MIVSYKKTFFLTWNKFFYSNNQTSLYSTKVSKHAYTCLTLSDLSSYVQAVRRARISTACDVTIVGRFSLRKFDHFDLSARPVFSNLYKKRPKLKNLLTISVHATPNQIQNDSTTNLKC